MCGDSSRVSHGGLLAVIHPVSNSSSASPRPYLKSCRLSLSNRGSEGTVSQIHYGSDAEATNWIRQRLQVRIHQSGQLFYCPSSRQVGLADPFTPSNPVIHSFYINQPGSAWQTFSGDSAMTATVLERINLGVGENGVVGRAVSILDEQQVVVGEGIIGWN